MNEDVATSAAVMSELHRRIPGSRYVVFEGGTHYTPLEYPVELDQALENFFAEQVFPDSWQPD